jgi:hypothetical protein
MSISCGTRIRLLKRLFRKAYFLDGRDGELCDVEEAGFEAAIFPGGGGVVSRFL